MHQLNEDTVWAGGPEERDRVGAYKYLTEARQLLFEGKYTEAQNLIQKEFMGRGTRSSYQTLGDLHLQFQSSQNITDPSIRRDIAGFATNYRRELDLDTAIASVTYRNRRDAVTKSRRWDSSAAGTTQSLAERLSKRIVCPWRIRGGHHLERWKAHRGRDSLQTR
jgi:hypothetical protein